MLCLAFSVLEVPTFTLLGHEVSFDSRPSDEALAAATAALQGSPPAAKAAGGNGSAIDPEVQGEPYYNVCAR